MAPRPYLSDNRMWEMFGMRALATVPYGGADLGEVHSTVTRVGEDGTYDDWHREWSATAERVRAIGDASRDAGHRVSAREAYFRAATYHQVSYAPLFGSPDDPRLVSSFEQVERCMADALALADHPVDIIEIPFEGGSLPAYHSRVDDSGSPRPTIVHTNGYDSTIAEMYFQHCVAANARGYDIVVFDGPGQGRNLIRDGQHLRPDWETVVTPVIDHLLTLPGVDPDRIVLAGWSFGGYLAPRAATAEHRIAALVADAGLYDMKPNVVARLPIDDDAKAAFPDIDPALLDPLEQMVQGPDADPFLRWQLVQRGMWVNGAGSLYEYFADMCRFELSSVVDGIRCPTWIATAEGDPNGAGAQQLFDALKVENKVLVRFTDDEGAGGHCEATARRLFHQRMYDWLDETLGR